MKKHKAGKGRVAQSWMWRFLMASALMLGASNTKASAEIAPANMPIIVQPRINCPPGYWQSNSATVPFCVNEEHSTYQDTPVCFLTETCRSVRFEHIKSPLKMNQETLADNWGHYKKTKGSSKGLPYIKEIDLDESIKLSEAWPGLKGKATTWGSIAKLSCSDGKCQNMAKDLRKRWNALLPNQYIVALLNWSELISIWNPLSTEKLARSNTLVSADYIPANWLKNSKVQDVIEELDLWKQTIDEAGYSQPTAGQAGMLYYQMVMVASSSGGMSLSGMQQFTYDNRIPSDLTAPNENPGASVEPILTGSNRFIKDRCRVSGGQGQGYNNCAHIKVRINKQHTKGNQIYILVSGEQERLSGKGGGDLIVPNIKEGDPSFTLHDGDFRGIEVVGSTNDEPLLPNGSNVEQGLMLDQCKIVKPIMAPLIEEGELQIAGTKKRVYVPYVRILHIMTKRMVPAYATDPCPNRYRSWQSVKTVLTMDAQENYLTKIARTCSTRKIYKYMGEFPIGTEDKVWPYPKRYAGAADKFKPIIACNSVDEISGSRNLIVRDQPIPWPIRGGLMSKQN